MISAWQHIRMASAVLFNGVRRIVDVVLHIGAHRTGTTTLQSYLAQNRVELLQAGAEVWGPERTRSGLFSGLVKRPDDITREVAQRAQRSTGRIKMEMHRLHHIGRQSLIVSEENMIGAMGNNLRASRLYPAVGARLDRFATAFGDRCRRIAISIRSYDSYWASGLAFALPRGRAMPDQTALDRLVTQPMRWRQLIEQAAAVFPRAEVVVWPFEAFCGQPERQLSLMLGDGAALPGRGRREWINASPGRDALRRVLLDRDEAEAAERLPAGDGRWQPFAPHQSAVLRAQYQEDLTWLRHGADGLATYIEDAHQKTRPLTDARGHRHDEEERSVG